MTDTGIPDDVCVQARSSAALRQALAKVGHRLSGTYYGESFGNWGGFKQGVTYDGVLDMHLDADMKKLGLWKGLCFHTNAFQIHGHSITADNIGSLDAGLQSRSDARHPSRRDVVRAAPVQRSASRVKIGQLAADTEFILSESYSYFLNGTWGWPSIAAADLPSGGPAYPLATPGVLVAVTPNDQVEAYGRSLQRRSRGSQLLRAQTRRSATATVLISVSTSPPLLMVEGGYKYNQGDSLCLARSRLAAGIISAPSTISASTQAACRSP